MSQNRRAEGALDRDRSLKPKNEVSLSFFSFMFCEIVQQFMKREKEANQKRQLLDAEAQKSAAPIPEMERELHELGKPVGERMLELTMHRQKGT